MTNNIVHFCFILNQDEFYLGVILKCTNPEEVRCCGVSIEKVVGAKSVTSEIVIVTDVPSTTSETTTTASSTTPNIESVTILSETDMTEPESNEQIESQTVSDNEINTSYEMTEPSGEELTKMTTVPTVPTIREENVELEGRNRDVGILSVFPAEISNNSDASYMQIINNSPAMLVYAAKDGHLTVDDDEGVNAITASNLPQNEESNNSNEELAQTEAPEEAFESMITEVESMITEAAPSIDEVINSTEKTPSMIEEPQNEFRNKLSNDSITETASESIRPSLDEMIESKVNENPTENDAIDKMLETITILPQIDINDLVNNEEDSVSSSTESSSTTVTESNVTVPDLISTIEMDNTIPERHNKRRNSIYRGDQSEPDTNELEITSSTTPLSRKLFKLKGFAGANKTITNIETDQLPKIVEFPKYNPKIVDDSVSGTMENEHKKQIVDVQSLLAMIRKQTGTEKPTINRSNSLQQLIANDKQQFKPIFGRRHYQSIQRTTTTPLPVVTSQTMEIETQTKSNRKYQRRLPAKKFNIYGKTTTTTTSTTESPIERVTFVRNRFSRRRQTTTQTPKIELTMSSITLTTPSTNEQSLENQINVKASLERRKKLFASRRRGGWSTAVESSNEMDASTENKSASLDVSSENPVRKPYKMFSNKHRFNLRSSHTDNSDAAPSIEEIDS